MVLAASIRPRKPGISYDWVWSGVNGLSRNTPNLQDTETISIKRVYKAPSPSITGSQLTHSFAMMLGMTRRKSGAVEVDVAASLSVLGSSRNTADNKAVGDPSIRYNP